MLWIEDAESVSNVPNETEILPTLLAFARALSHKCQILYVQVPMGIICIPRGWPVDVDNEPVFKESCNESSSIKISCLK